MRIFADARDATRPSTRGTFAVASGIVAVAFAVACSNHPAGTTGTDTAHNSAAQQASASDCSAVPGKDDLTRLLHTAPDSAVAFVLNLLNTIYSVAALVAVSLYQFPSIAAWFNEAMGRLWLCQQFGSGPVQCVSDIGFVSADARGTAATITLLPWFVACTSNIVLFTLSGTERSLSSSSSSSSSSAAAAAAKANGKKNNNSSGGTGGSGVTNADGKYEARHQSNKAGIEPGTYMVLFSKIAMPDGSSIPAGKNAADVGATEILPQPLSNPDPEFAPNVVTITESGGSFDFTLASK